jgi:hypothetical protein
VPGALCRDAGALIEPPHAERVEHARRVASYLSAFSGVEQTVVTDDGGS